MTSGCTYFDVDAYPGTADDWTQWDWPATVWEHVADRPLTGLFPEDRERADGSGQYAFADVPEETTPRELVGGDLTEREFVSIWTERTDEVPAGCPHDAVDGRDRCAFHLPPARTPVETDALVDRMTDDLTTTAVGANFDVVDLERALVESDANRQLRLDFCTIDRLSLDKAVLQQDLSLRYATVGEFLFERATFAADLDLSHARVRRRMVGRHATFDGQVRGVAADLACDDPVDVQDATFQQYVCFDGARFRSDLELWNCVFRADVEFRLAEFDGEVNARWVDFHRFPDFHGSTFAGVADFGGTTFFDDAGFSAIEFRDDVHFQSEYNSFDEYAAVFHGVADFTRSTFAGEFNLRETEFKKYASFRHVTVDGEAVLWNAEFGEDADFFDATFGDDVDLRWSKFHGFGDFNDTAFHGLANFGGSWFGDDIAFSNAVFDGDVQFRGEFREYDDYKSECHGVVDFGDATFRGSFDVNAIFRDEVSFTDATFEDDVVIDARFEGVADFTDAQFHDDVTLTDTEFRSGAVFASVRAPRAIDMSHVLLRGGLVSQPEGSTTYYDFYRATVGEVDLEPKDDSRLFDYFRFCETTFENFDFPQHGEALIGNWRIHEFGADDDPVSLSELINTYLKAKNGASAVGAKTAAAEFFIREMRFRRKKHWAEATDGSVFSRALSAGRWASNWFLNVSCGYGERPLRTVSLSLVLIGLFAVVYRLLGLGGAPSVLTYLLFSTQAFVTLIFGQTPEVQSLAVQFTAAIQGFIGAFFIALFVFALTRSIHR